MNKKELIVTLAETLDITQRESTEYLNALLDIVTERLVEGDHVKLVGFGTLSTRHRKERAGVNPSNGVQMIIPAKTVVRFKVGKDLADAVNTK